MAEAEATPTEEISPETPETNRRRIRSLNGQTGVESPGKSATMRKGRSLETPSKGGGAPNPLPNSINQAILKLQPSYKKKNHDFHALFHGVPESEILIDDYSCAIQKDILLHGRMYITAESFYFFSNVFGYETKLVIRCSDVTAIHKAKTALVFPNAIEIHAGDSAKYGFSSFISRDASFHVMFKVWQNVLLEMPMSAQDLLQYAKQTWRDDSVDEPAEKDGEEFELIELPHYKAETKPKGIDEAGVSGTTSRIREERQYDGPVPDPIGREFLCEEFPFTAERLYTMIFTKSPFSERHMEQRKATNLNWGQWESNEDTSVSVREFSYTLPLHATFGPKSVDIVETQTLIEDSQPGLYYNIEAEANNKNIPFADSFYVFVQYCIWQISSQASVLRVCSEVKFRKSVFIKGAIEKSAIKGTQNQCKILKENLDEVKRQVGQPSPRRITVKAGRRRSNAMSFRPARRPPSRAASVEGSTQSESCSPNRFIWMLILLSLVCLIAFNAFLYYRFFSYRHVLDPLTTMKSIEGSRQKLVDVLKKQQQFYSVELERWKAIVSLSVNLLSEIKGSLEAVQKEIHSLTDQFSEESTIDSAKQTN
ncbi:protein Aster-B-like [Oscarella lobularis]|uniref:protein Aster-B-like n=1 Tax=Oscarella lobularis TaxID=121494 RepID=UPI003314236B